MTLLTDQLTVESVPAYLVARPHLAGPVDPASIVSVVEVGDGNLNLVFIVKDAAGNGVVVKQSLPHVRVDPSWPLTRERAAREAVVLGAGHLIEHYDALKGMFMGARR